MIIPDGRGSYKIDKTNKGMTSPEASQAHRTTAFLSPISSELIMQEDVIALHDVGLAAYAFAEPA